MPVISGKKTITRGTTAAKKKTTSGRSAKFKAKPSKKSDSLPKDSVTLSKEAESTASSKSTKPTSKPSDKPTAAELRAQEERDHITNLDKNYDVFDNPGGGKTDGKVSKKDIEKVAKGEYDRDKTIERLKDAGVADKDIDKQLEGLEKTANYLLENDSVRNKIDIANDKDKKVDNEIARGDLDKIMIEVDKGNREQRVKDLERKANEPLSESHIKEAQGAIDRWTEPGALDKELKNKPLSEFSEAELDALAAVNQNNPDSRKAIESAILRTVDGAESLDDLPKGDSFNYLLDNHVTGKEVKGTDEQKAVDPTAVAQRQLGALVKDEIEHSIDQRLDDRRGDGELDLAIERITGDLEDIAIDNPALIGTLEAKSKETFEEYADEFTDVARADDSRLSKLNHAVTGGIRKGVGFVTDGFRAGVSLTAKISTAPQRLLGKVANVGLDVAGKAAGAGLDAVGADGAADSVRHASDKLGDYTEEAVNKVADLNEGFVNGAGESVAGAVDGIAYLATDPVGTVKGIGKVIQDPSLLVEGYKETYEEHGAGGVAGQVVGDVALTVLTGGGGGAAKGAAAAGRVASFASRGGRVANFAARGATRAQTLFDDAGRVGAQARNGIRTNGRIRTAVRETGERLRGNDAPVFARQSQRVRQNFPEVIASSQKVVDNFQDIGRSASRAEVLEILNNPTTRQLAKDIDKISAGSTKLPKGVGTTVRKADGSLIEGREAILEYITDPKNASKIPDADLRRIGRSLFGESDFAGPAFLTRLDGNEELFRSYSSTKVDRVTGETVVGDAGGTYLGRAVDRRLTPEQHRANNSLPKDTLADQGVLFSPPADTLTVVTRVAPQEAGARFGEAAGGGWQLQATNSADILDAFSDIQPGTPVPNRPPSPETLDILDNSPNPLPKTPTTPIRPSIFLPFLDDAQRQESSFSFVG